ncbi:MAG TPA: tetratricopeptide repeat protein [Candidatus Acidoferrales bacterium]|nr:tetratricopeptide repeat protein [Candidatus Acidoferrales bacterium]
MRNVLICASIFCLALCASAVAQNVKPAQQKNAPAPGQQAASYNPLRALHDVEVGKFYLRRGDYDGAIARFKDALLYKDNYAEPRLLLGEAYEKKNDPATAIRYFEEYLKILPESPQSKTVKERITRLKEKLQKNAADAKR